jgi:outer membrane protein insertion porin family
MQQPQARLRLRPGWSLQSRTAAPDNAAMTAPAERATYFASANEGCPAPSALAWLFMLAAVLGLALAAAADAQPESDRIYVRRIEFIGVTAIDDTALRQEMLQLEGTYLNTSALEESRRRIERLPYVASARTALRPVPATANLVDVTIEIIEAPARRYGGGAGYSESSRTSVHGYFTNDNVLGTGQRFAAFLETSDLAHRLELSHTQPRTRAGLSRSIGVETRSVDRLTVDASALDAEAASFRLEYGYETAPRSVTSGGHALCCPALRGAALGPGPLLGRCCSAGVRLGTELRAVDIAAGLDTSSQLRDWIADVDPAAVGTAEIDELDFTLVWQRDTRDTVPFPSRGTEQRLGFRASLPGSDLEYFAADYEIASHRPFGDAWTGTVRAKLAYGAAYTADSAALPPYLHWFAGGPGTVRGYREDTLGPRDSNGRPYGGNLLAAVQLEVSTAWPKRWRDTTRVGFFFDIGNVYSTEHVGFQDADGAALDYGFDAGELRQSAGIAMRFALPFGLVQVSYGVPLDAQDSPSPFHRDEEERWQLSLDVGF